MGTSAGAAARRIAEETEVFKTQRAGLTLGKAIMQARTDKKMNQKDLGACFPPLSLTHPSIRDEDQRDRPGHPGLRIRQGRAQSPDHLQARESPRRQAPQAPQSSQEETRRLDASFD
mmetsp:Transcript_13558/g.44186  ORF Transcript_13558/g.44186 Transcript_13558/m.44186 type:complete len:117 (-) Transcript_13558:143-493(-)